MFLTHLPFGDIWLLCVFLHTCFFKCHPTPFEWPLATFFMIPGLDDSAGSIELLGLIFKDLMSFGTIAMGATATKNFLLPFFHRQLPQQFLGIIIMQCLQIFQNFHHLDWMWSWGSLWFHHQLVLKKVFLGFIITFGISKYIKIIIIIFIICGNCSDLIIIWHFITCRFFDLAPCTIWLVESQIFDWTSFLLWDCTCSMYQQDDLQQNQFKCPGYHGWFIKPSPSMWWYMFHQIFASKNKILLFPFQKYFYWMGLNRYWGEQIIFQNSCCIGGLSP